MHSYHWFLRPKIEVCTISLPLTTCNCLTVWLWTYRSPMLSPSLQGISITILMGFSKVCFLSRRHPLGCTSNSIVTSSSSPYHSPYACSSYSPVGCILRRCISQLLGLIPKKNMILSYIGANHQLETRTSINHGTSTIHHVLSWNKSRQC